MAPHKQPAIQQQVSSDEFYKRTVARIQGIQGHLSQTPRGNRLKGKVCVITGVGSLKGIGCVYLNASFLHPKSSIPLDICSRASAMLFAHEGRFCSTEYVALLMKALEGAQHLYLLDYSEENLPNLKSMIERTYPDVKVCYLHLSTKAWLKLS